MPRNFAQIGRWSSGAVVLFRVAIVIISIFQISGRFSALAQNSPDIPAGQNTEADKATIQHFAGYYLSTATTFRCRNFAWGSFLRGHMTIQLEFVPDGDNVESWTRLMTINLYPLPKETPAQIEAMAGLRTHLLDNYQAHGKILKQELYETSQGYPRLFIEYEIGEGIQKEHGAGAFLMSAPNVASFIQIQARGKPFDANDADNMRLLAQSKLKTAPPN
jgi:hypothetical protein